MLLNLLNAFVTEEQAPLENPATLLRVLWPVSVTSAFRALPVASVFLNRS